MVQGRIFPILLWYWIFLALQGQEQGQDGNKKSQGGKKGRTFSLLLKGKGVCYIHTVMFNLLGINSICPVLQENSFKFKHNQYS